MIMFGTWIGGFGWTGTPLHWIWMEGGWNRLSGYEVPWDVVTSNESLNERMNE